MSFLCSSDEEQRSSSGGSGEFSSGLLAPKLHRERKRVVHNEVERRRKDKISAWIFHIENMLPAEDTQKKCKNGILERTVEYISYLKNANEKLLAGGITDVHKEELLRLHQQVVHLEAQNKIYSRLLRQAGIHPVTPMENHLWSQPKKFAKSLSAGQASALFKMRKSESKQNKVKVTKEVSLPVTTNCVTNTTQFVSSSQTLVTQALPAEPLMSTTAQNMCLTVQKDNMTHYVQKDSGLTHYIQKDNGLTHYVQKDNGLTHYIQKDNGLTHYVQKDNALTHYTPDTFSGPSLIVLNGDQRLITIQNKSVLVPNELAKENTSPTSMLLQNGSKLFMGGNGIVTIRPPQDRPELSAGPLCQSADGLKTSLTVCENMTESLPIGTLQPAIVPFGMAQPATAFGPSGPVAFNQPVSFNQQNQVAFNQQGQMITLGPGTLLTGQQPWTGSLPSALLLPNGQIIPVVSQASIMYTNATPVNHMNSSLVLGTPTITARSSADDTLHISSHHDETSKCSTPVTSDQNLTPPRCVQSSKKDKNTSLLTCPKLNKKASPPLKQKTELSGKGKAQRSIRPKSTPPSVTTSLLNSEVTQTNTTHSIPTSTSPTRTCHVPSLPVSTPQPNLNHNSPHQTTTTTPPKLTIPPEGPISETVVSKPVSNLTVTCSVSHIVSSAVSTTTVRLKTSQPISTTACAQNGTSSKSRHPSNCDIGLPQKCNQLKSSQQNQSSTLNRRYCSIQNQNIPPTSGKSTDLFPEGSATDILAKATESIFSCSLTDISPPGSNFSRTVSSEPTTSSKNSPLLNKPVEPCYVTCSIPSDSRITTTTNSSIMQSNVSEKALLVSKPSLNATEIPSRICMENNFEPPEKRAKVREISTDTEQICSDLSSVVASPSKPSQQVPKGDSTNSFPEALRTELNPQTVRHFPGNALPQILRSGSSEINSGSLEHQGPCQTSSASLSSNVTSGVDAHDISSFVNSTDNSDHDLPALILSSLGEDSDAPSSVNSSSNSGLQFLALSPPEQFGTELANPKEPLEQNTFNLMTNQTSYCQETYSCHKNIPDRSQHVFQDKEPQSVASLDCKQRPTCDNANRSNQNQQAGHQLTTNTKQQQSSLQQQSNNLQQQQQSSNLQQQSNNLQQSNNHQQQQSNLQQSNNIQQQQSSNLQQQQQSNNLQQQSNSLQQQQQSNTHQQQSVLLHIPESSSFLCSSMKKVECTTSSQQPPPNSATISSMATSMHSNIPSHFNFVNNHPPPLLSRSYHESIVNSTLSPPHTNFILPVLPPAGPFELPKDPPQLSDNRIQNRCQQRESPFGQDRNPKPHLPPRTSLPTTRHSVPVSNIDSSLFSQHTSTNITTNNNNNNNHAILSNYSTEALLGHQTSSTVSGTLSCLNTVQCIPQTSVPPSCSRSTRSLLPYSTESLLQSQPYADKKEPSNVLPGSYPQPFPKLPPASSSQSFFPSEPPCLPCSSLSSTVVSHTPSFSHSAPGQHVSNTSGHHHFNNSLLMPPFQEPHGLRNNPAPTVASFSQPYTSFSLPNTNSTFQNRGGSLNCLQSVPGRVDPSSSHVPQQHQNQQHSSSNMQQAAGPLLQLAEHSGFPPLIPPLSEATSNPVSSRPVLNHFPQPPPPQNHFFPNPFVTGISSRNCLPNHTFLDAKSKEILSRASVSRSPQPSTKASPKSKSKKSKQTECYIDRNLSYFPVPELSNERFFSSPRGPAPQNLLPPPPMPLTDNRQAISSSSQNYSQAPLFRPQSQLNFQSFSSLPTPRNANQGVQVTSNTGPAGPASSHVPNFNLSNIFPDMSSTDNLTISPIKFPSNLHSNVQSSDVCPTTGTNRTPLYTGSRLPNSFNGILSSGSVPFERTSMASIHQNFPSSSAPSFGNVIPPPPPPPPPLSFPVHEH